jgi:plasmid stabilization system protein ParE
VKRVLWHAEARADITSIFDHFRAKDARVASLLVERVESAVGALAKRDTGRPGRMANLREKSVPRTRYIIAYRVRGDDLIVLRVIHSSQNWTSARWPKSD